MTYVINFGGASVCRAETLVEAEFPQVKTGSKCSLMWSSNGAFLSCANLPWVAGLEFARADGRALRLCKPMFNLSLKILPLLLFASLYVGRPVIGASEAGLESAADPADAAGSRADDNPADAPARDIMLVLDNSGSMKQNDPDFLVSRAVNGFIRQQGPNIRVGVVLFDQRVRMPLALAARPDAGDTDYFQGLDYTGRFTDSPAGMERAIYELKNNGRPAAGKQIIFMTDGIVDTGEARRDMEKTGWLREELAPDAAEHGIRIFGIVFTEAADFQLIQSITRQTGGEYYRAPTAAALEPVFDRLNRALGEPAPAPESAPAPAAEIEARAAEPVSAAPAPAPIIIEAPSEDAAREERIRSIITVAVAIILVAMLIGILILLIRQERASEKGEKRFTQQAFINDLHGKTNKATHKLGEKPLMFGRVAGQDSENFDYVVIDEATVGRRHALIEFRDHACWIIDQGSINGTFVNGRMVETRQLLKHGDRIRLYKCEFEFIMPELEDIASTVVSNTVFAAQAARDEDEDTTELNQRAPGAKKEKAMSFNLGGVAESEEETNSDDRVIVREGDS